MKLIYFDAFDNIFAKITFSSYEYNNFSEGQIILKPVFGWIFATVLLLVIIAFAFKELKFFIKKLSEKKSIKKSDKSITEQTNEKSTDSILSSNQSISKEVTDETISMSIRRLIMCILISICILCPCVMRNTTHRSISATNVIFVLDVTGSMKVKDANYASSKNIERIRAAKLIINDVAKSYNNASFTGIRFGTSTSIDVPLTPDANAIENWANTIQTEPTGISSGTSLDAPIDQTLLVSKAIHDSHPEDINVLYLISDGEETTNRKRRTFSSLRAYINNAFVITVGSKEGGKIPLSKNALDSDENNDEDKNANSQDDEDKNENSNSWVIDPSTGKPGISKADDKNMKNIADELSGSFIHAKYEDRIGSEAKNIMSKKWRDNKTFKARLRPEPIVWPFALMLSLVMLYELCLLYTSDAADEGGIV